MRLIDADVLNEELKSFFLTITGNPEQTEVVKECKKSFAKMIDEQPTAYDPDKAVEQLENPVEYRGSERMDRKQQIKEYIVDYITIHGYPPTVREIADDVGLGSTSSVQHYLVKMLETGMIETDAPGSPRAIRVPGLVVVKE